MQVQIDLVEHDNRSNICRITVLEQDRVLLCRPYGAQICHPCSPTLEIHRQGQWFSNLVTIGDDESHLPDPFPRGVPYRNTSATIFWKRRATTSVAAVSRISTSALRQLAQWIRNTLTIRANIGAQIFVTGSARDERLSGGAAGVNNNPRKSEAAAEVIRRTLN